MNGILRTGGLLTGAFLLGSGAAWAGTCESLVEAAPEGVTITEAVMTAASDEVPVDHCLVRGRMAERTGMDGEPYAISFELRLPDDWQGRFMHQFNGGSDGVVVPALGLGVGVGAPAITRGFAIVSSNAGNDREAQPEAGLTGGVRFGLDFEARRNFGYGAVAQLNPVALALVEANYGRAPEHSYGYGRSNGGRHAMVAAARMPDAFDGLLVGYPGFNLPQAALQHALDAQAFLSVGESLPEAFSQAELAIVSDAIAAACDALDGLDDGVVFATARCQQVFDPATIVCREGQTEGCLPSEKVRALETIHAGPKNSAGELLYATWPWDTGIDSENWRFWKLESAVPPWNNQPLIAVMGAGALAHIFTTPPTEVEGTPEALEAYLLEFDFDEDAPRIFATTEAFPESAVEMIVPPESDNPTLDDFVRAGGRMITYHGVSDPVFSLHATVAWHERLLENNPAAAEAVRLYAIPGMPHGTGGNAPHEVDLLHVLIEWVEGAEIPGAVPARFSVDHPEVAPENAGAERLLCPWPSYAVYREGDPASAGSFTCE